MKVVHIVQRLAPGGLEVLALDLMRHMPGPTEAHIISLEGTAAQLVQDWPRLAAVQDQITAFEKPAGFAPLLVNRVRAELKKRAPDIVHTHHIGPLLYGGLAARFAGKVAHIHTEHDIWHLQSPKARRLEQVLLRLCDPMHVAITGEMAKDLQAIFGRKVHLVENGVDTNRFTPSVAPVQDMVIGAAGRLAPVKGMDLLIDGFASFAATEDGQSAKLVIAGDGAEREKLAAQINHLVAAGKIAEGQIRLAGLIDDMPAFLQTLSHFVQPSRAEGLPLAPLEAMAAGLPVLVTPTSGAETLQRAGALIAHDISSAAIAEGLGKLIRTPIEPQAIRSNIVQGFSLEVMAGRYADLYRQAMGAAG